MMKYLSNFGIALTAVFIGFASFYAIYLRPLPNPQTLVGRELVTPIVKIGDPIEIKITVVRTRACPTTVHTWFLDETGRVVKSSIVNSPFSSVVGKTSSVINLQTTGLHAGKYTVKADGIINCGKDGIYVNPNPSLEVEIVDK